MYDQFFKKSDLPQNTHSSKDYKMYFHFLGWGWNWAGFWSQANWSNTDIRGRRRSLVQSFQEGDRQTQFDDIAQDFPCRHWQQICAGQWSTRVGLFSDEPHTHSVAWSQWVSERKDIPERNWHLYRCDRWTGISLRFSVVFCGGG